MRSSSSTGRCILAAAVIVSTFVLAAPAGALEESVEKDACKGEVWRGLVDRAGNSFRNLGGCVSAAIQGDAFTDPRFTSATVDEGTSFSRLISFHQIGMLPGDIRHYLGLATVTLTDECRPLGSSSGDPTRVATLTTSAVGGTTATVDEAGEVTASFTIAPLSSAGPVCGYLEQGTRHPQVVFSDFILVDTGKYGNPIVYPIP